jgi:hypothetical protein
LRNFDEKLLKYRFSVLGLQLPGPGIESKRKKTGIPSFQVLFFRFQKTLFKTAGFSKEQIISGLCPLIDQDQDIQLYIFLLLTILQFAVLILIREEFLTNTYLVKTF